jgi:DNA repair photolyase
VGIARLASSSPLTDAKRGVEYFALPARSILNKCDSKRVDFPWTINPYRGCEFGCKYCYARYTHEYMELDGGDFERKIFVKKDAAQMAARELLSRVKPGEHIAIGSATDPYQPAEREFCSTRRILQEMAKLQGLSVSITTKSNLVVRDIDLLQRIAERSEISVNLTITTPRTRLAALLEPRAPRPELRFAAVRKLREAGIPAGVFAIPVLPALTDSEEDLDTLARTAKEADALWFSASVLFLMPSSRAQFFPFIQQKFPRLMKRYEECFGRAAYLPDSYRREWRSRVEAIRRKYKLGSRPAGDEEKCARPPEQMSLNWCG